MRWQWGCGGGSEVAVRLRWRVLTASPVSFEIRPKSVVNKSVVKLVENRPKSIENRTGRDEVSNSPVWLATQDTVSTGDGTTLPDATAIAAAAFAVSISAVVIWSREVVMVETLRGTHALLSEKTPPEIEL